MPRRAASLTALTAFAAAASTRWTLMLLAPLALLGQNDPITRVTVNQVRIDAVVTDANGNLVPNLHESDFEVFQDGRRQQPIHVAYVAGPAASDARASNRELKSNEINRTIVVLLDDAGMAIQSFNRARDAIRTYLAQSMQPGDLVAVLRTTQTSSYLNPLMSDPAAVRLAVDRMQYRKSAGYYRGVYVYPLLRSVLGLLNRMPGRKSLVLFCDRMAVAANTPYGDPLQLFRDLADLAIRSAVRIYGIDSRGLSAYKTTPTVAAGIEDNLKQVAEEPAVQVEREKMETAISDAMSPVDANFPPRPSDPRLTHGGWWDAGPPRPVHGDMDGLAFLARETGGLMLENKNNLGEQIQMALREQSAYYLIAWDPGEKAFAHTKGTFADFHNISVKMTRAGLKARTPLGFYGVDHGTGPVSAHVPKVDMQEALLAPFQSGSFDARMNSQFELDGDRGFILSFVYIAGKDIVFTPHADSRRNDCYAIHLEFLTLPQPIDATVETLAESQISSLEMCGTSYEAIARDGLAVTMLHPVQKPGGYQMRLAVRNVDATTAAPSLSQKQRTLTARFDDARPVGSAHQLVVVPDWSTAPSLFGLHVESDKLPDSVSRPRLPGETDKNMTLAYRPAASGDPALRIFKPGDRIRYQAQLTNVTGVKAEMRITRAGAGDATVIYQGPVDEIAESKLSGIYTLDPGTPPGDYDLQLGVGGVRKAANQLFQSVLDVEFEVRQ